MKSKELLLYWILLIFNFQTIKLETFKVINTTKLIILSIN